MFGNRTNNRIESLKKLKAVITKYSSLPVFFNELMACVSAIRIEKDVYTAELLIKRPVVTTNFAPHDQKYRKLLTEFAFEKYFEESMNSGQIQFHDIDDRVGVIRLPNNRNFLVTMRVCDCNFYSLPPRKRI